MDQVRKYIASLSQVTEHFKQAGNINKDVVVAIDGSNDIIKQLLNDNLDLRPRYFDTIQNPTYEYEENSNTFSLNIRSPLSEKRTRKNARVKVKICGGKPDDITIILAVVTSKPLEH